MVERVVVSAGASIGCTTCSRPGRREHPHAPHPRGQRSGSGSTGSVPRDPVSAPSGATSSTSPSSTYGQQLPQQELEWSDKGGVARTDHSLLKRGVDPRTDHASSVAPSEGGDPRTAKRPSLRTRAVTQRPTKRVPVFWRAISWWLLLQSWATLRFDDHCGIYTG